MIRYGASMLYLSVAAVFAVMAGCASTHESASTSAAGMEKVNPGVQGTTTNVVVKDYNPDIVRSDDQCTNILQRDPRCSTVDCFECAKAGHQGAKAAMAAPAAVAAAPAAGMGGMCAGQSAELTDTNPGVCYVKVWNEPKYNTVMQKTLIKPAGERIEIVPARYEKRETQVVVQPARKELQTVPAEYDTVTEKVLVRPAYTRTESIPAVYDISEEQVLVKAAYKTWKPGTFTAIQKVDEATGQILCLVEVPAEYKTETKRTLRTPEQTKSFEVPAEYADVQKTVLKTPEKVIEVEVAPPVTEMVLTEVLVEPAKQMKAATEAEYAEVATMQLAENGCYSWSQILCDTNMTQDTVTKLQTALSDAGFYSGAPTGTFDSATFEAVKAYEKANNLPQDGYLNIETARTLGVTQ